MSVIKYYVPLVHRQSSPPNLNAKIKRAIFTINALNERNTIHSYQEMEQSIKGNKHTFKISNEIADFCGIAATTFTAAQNGG